MMPTENDLRTALAAIADHAHDSVEPALATASPRRHPTFSRRSVVMPLAAAAIVAAVTVGGIAVRDSLDDSRTNAPAANPPVRTASRPAASTSTSSRPVAGSMPVTRYVFDVDLPGWKSSGVFTSPGAQQIELTNADGTERAAVTLFAPDGWAPTRPRGAVAVDVKGEPGFYGRVTASVTELDGEVVPGARATATGSSVTLPGALAWQYRPGAWALVHTFAEQKTPAPPLTRQQALTIADAVRPGQSQSIAVPARFSSAPAGLQLQGVTTRPAASGISGGSALYSFGPGGTSHTTLIVSVSPATSSSSGLGSSVAIGNFRGRLVTRDDLELTDGTVDLALLSLIDDGTGPRTPDGDEPVLGLPKLRAIVAGMTLAPSLADPSTWFDATTAVG